VQPPLEVEDVGDVVVEEAVEMKITIGATLHTVVVADDPGDVAEAGDVAEVGDVGDVVVQQLMDPRSTSLIATTPMKSSTPLAQMVVHKSCGFKRHETNVGMLCLPRPSLLKMWRECSLHSTVGR
jgi:hypothetical protein